MIVCISFSSWVGCWYITYTWIYTMHMLNCTQFCFLDDPDSWWVSLKKSLPCELVWRQTRMNFISNRIRSNTHTGILFKPWAWEPHFDSWLSVFILRSEKDESLWLFHHWPANLKFWCIDATNTFCSYIMKCTMIPIEHHMITGIIHYSSIA